MKTKITYKEIKNQFIISLPYGKCYDVFEGVEPAYYNAGVNGWNCDIWYDDIANVYYISGYRYPSNMVDVHLDGSVEEMKAFVELMRELV